MNVLFTTSAAPQISPFFTGEKRPPLGMGSLISITRNEGHKVFFIDNYLGPSNFIEDGFLQKNDIDFVGIYANTICYRDTLRMFRAIEVLRKKGLWKGRVIVGGPHTSVAADTVPDFVDHVVQGEGEIAVLDILNGGVSERVVRRERIGDLDSLPFQPWDIFSRLPYDFTCRWIDRGPIFTMNTSRGCPSNCSFCSVGSIWGKQYKFISAERIIAEIELMITDYGAKGIYFREDNFTVNRKRLTGFCEKLIQKNINIPWACETRVNSINDEEVVKLMSAAGCRGVYLGVESGSQRVLDLLKKGITVGQIEKAVSLCKKYNIRSYCSLITGVPGETYEDYLETKNLMEKLKPHSYIFNVFVGVPDSPLYRSVLENNEHEYMDDLGLLYLPGYDVKAGYFHGRTGPLLNTGYEFKMRTDFDRKLLKEKNKGHLNKVLGIGRNKIREWMPCALKNEIKRLVNNA